MSLLTNAADWFKARDTRIEAWYDDDGGRYGFRVTVDDQPFIVVAKQYLNDGQASFFEGKVVQRGIDTDALILLFTANGKRLVFDPETVDAIGDHGMAEVATRKNRGERWVDVDADVSVSFEAWVDHGEEPPAPEDFGAGDDRPATPWDVTSWTDDRET